MEKNILIIDDDQEDQLLIKKFLGQEGFINVDCVDTGAEGIEKVRTEKPDVVILDTQLPGINGFETCKEIKQIEGLSVNIVMITGVVDAVDAGRAREMGADDYCVKTSNYSHVVDAVKKFVSE